MGGVVAPRDVKQQRFHLGLMAGYGHSNNKTRSSVTGYSSKGELNGYSVGMYLTWFENAADQSGWYTDSWLRWNDFNAKVSGDQLQDEKYHLRGITGAFETGYAWKVTGNDKTSFWIMPQAQITYLGVTSDDFTEHTGNKITGSGKAVETRLGVRSYITSLNRDGFIQPYVEFNVKNSSKDQTPQLDGTSVAAIGGKTAFETKVGVEAALTRQASLWVNTSYTTGSHDYQTLQGSVGFKLKF